MTPNGDDDAVTLTEVTAAVSVGDLSIDVLANILGFLCLQHIMQKRRVCKKWKEAVKITIVPPTDFRVESEWEYNAMRVMTEAMPNLQQITIGHLGLIIGHKWSDGEDPDEERAARTSDWTTHDIEIISNFRKLRNLAIFNSGINGRYPFLLNFPLLQKLSIQPCVSSPWDKWDLNMLAAGLPLLKELLFEEHLGLTGNINSLRVLKDTLEKVYLMGCQNIEGNFMDLADFPYLKELDLENTAVTGDIRDIGADNFSSLEFLDLPKGVYGGTGYEFRRISDGFDVVRTIHLFKRQRPTVEISDWWHATLSEDSPDRYDRADDDDDTHPFFICFVEAGSRLGYRWQTRERNPCEVNWLDPEPDSESVDYERHTEELQKIEDEFVVDSKHPNDSYLGQVARFRGWIIGMYRGFHEPPTEEEYNRLWERNTDENDESSEEEYNGLVDRG